MLWYFSAPLLKWTTAASSSTKSILQSTSLFLSISLASGYKLDKWVKLCRTLHLGRLLQFLLSSHWPFSTLSLLSSVSTLTESSRACYWTTFLMEDKWEAWAWDDVWAEVEHKMLKEWMKTVHNNHMVDRDIKLEVVVVAHEDHQTTLKLHLLVEEVVSSHSKAKVSRLEEVDQNLLQNV